MHYIIGGILGIILLVFIGYFLIPAAVGGVAAWVIKTFTVMKNDSKEIALKKATENQQNNIQSYNRSISDKKSEIQKNKNELKRTENLISNNIKEEISRSLTSYASNYIKELTEIQQLVLSDYYPSQLANDFSTQGKLSGHLFHNKMPHNLKLSNNFKKRVREIYSEIGIKTPRIDTAPTATSTRKKIKPNNTSLNKTAEPDRFKYISRSEITESTLTVRFQKMPQDIQNIMESPKIEASIRKVGNFHNLNNEQAGKLIDEIGLVLLKLTDKLQLTQELKNRLVISNSLAQAIYEDLKKIPDLTNRI